MEDVGNAVAVGLAGLVDEVPGDEVLEGARVASRG